MSIESVNDPNDSKGEMAWIIIRELAGWVLVAAVFSAVCAVVYFTWRLLTL
jgi:hypothetical protein